MCTYTIKIYHLDDRSYHQVAHGIDKIQKDALVSLCEKNGKTVLVQFNTELLQGSIIDHLKLISLGILGIF